MFMKQNQAEYSIDDFYNSKSQPVEHPKDKSQFNPYVNNEGTIMAISGENFVIVAGDTRLSNGSFIVSRSSSKLCQLTPKCILASSGMYADIIALQKYLKARIEIYRSTNRQDPSLRALVQMLSVTLYSRRFFPYYAFNCLCGQEEDGTFSCYGYDAVGSFDAFKYGAQGSGNALISPVLDKLVKNNPKITENEAKALVLTTMDGTSCRDIYTGDKVELYILRNDGELTIEEYPLRKD